MGLLDSGATNILVPNANMLHTIDSYESDHIEGMGYTHSQGTGSGTIVFPTDNGFTDPRDVTDALITPDQPLLLSEGALETFNIFRDSIKRTLFTSSSIDGPQDNIVRVGKPMFYEGIPRRTVSGARFVYSGGWHTVRLGPLSTGGVVPAVPITPSGSDAAEVMG